MRKRWFVRFCGVCAVLLACLALFWVRFLRVPDVHGYLADDAAPPVEVTNVATPVEQVSARAERQREAVAALDVAEPKQILFGDTHVHTTYSMDAYVWSLPLMQGSRGAFPPADVCDYARYVSQLDFYFLTDHAESYTPQRWRDQVESIRLCNEVAGDPANPDVAAFIGWEWTQVAFRLAGFVVHPFDQ